MGLEFNESNIDILLIRSVYPLKEKATSSRGCFRFTEIAYPYFLKEFTSDSASSLYFLASSPVKPVNSVAFFCT